MNPRTVAVIFSALPASRVDADPDKPTRNWSMLTASIRATPDPWMARSKLSPLTLSMANAPAPLIQALDKSCVPTVMMTGPELPSLKPPQLPPLSARTINVRPSTLIDTLSSAAWLPLALANGATLVLSVTWYGPSMRTRSKLVTE